MIGDRDMGLCLDFEHAVKAAVDYKEYVQGFMGLEPKMFHVSDGTLSEEKDEHLGIGEGEYDFGFLMGCIYNNRTMNYLTLETPRTKSNSLDCDLKNLNELIKLSSHNKVHLKTVNNIIS